MNMKKVVGRKVEELRIGNITQKSNKEKMANIGQIWPKVLVPFVNNYAVKLTASEVSRKTKIPRRTVSRIFDNLIKVNLVRYIIEGKNKKYYLDLKDQRIKLLIGFVEYYKSLKFSLEEEKVFLILEELMELRDVVLFGSYVKGNVTIGSDIDVLVIGSEFEKIREISRRQVKKINLHFSTLKNFEKLLKKKNTLAIEIMKNHIIFGSSQFAELCWRFYRNEL